MNKPHALYRFFDSADDLLYVGITCDLGRRLSQHQLEKPWWTDVARVTIEPQNDREAALVAEQMAIAQEKPRHNIVHNTRTTPWVFTTPSNGGPWPLPVSLMDVAAFGLHDGRCPIGLVTCIDEEGVALGLWLFLDGSFGNTETWRIRWTEISVIRQARRKSYDELRSEGWIESRCRSRTYDIGELGGFQTQWKARAGREIGHYSGHTPNTTTSEPRSRSDSSDRPVTRETNLLSLIKKRSDLRFSGGSDR